MYFYSLKNILKTEEIPLVITQTKREFTQL
jgi:hypothetical protein